MAALQGWRIILLINIASIGLLSAGILAGQALPSGLHTHGPGIDGQMLAWDGTCTPIRAKNTVCRYASNRAGS